VSGSANYPVWCAAFSPDGQQIAVATDDLKCLPRLSRVDAILEGRAASPVTLGEHYSAVRSLAFSHDVMRIA